MATLHKYLFDLDFGAPAARPNHDAYNALGLSVDESLLPPPEPEQPEAVEPPPPPPPTFMEEDVILAREQGYQAGYAAGKLEEETSTGRQVAEADQAIAQALRDWSERQRLDHEQRLRDAVAVAVAVVRKMLPDFSQRSGLNEIEAVIQSCLTQLDKDVRVTVRVNERHMDELRERSEALADSVAFEGKLLFTADSRIAPGDCRVEWGGGGAERDQTRLQQEIDAVIARALEDVVAEPEPEPA